MEVFSCSGATIEMTGSGGYAAGVLLRYHTPCSSWALSTFNAC
jgi:hypothetical protein